MDALLTINLFGPMQVFIGSDPMPRVRSRKAMWLLALLVLRDGRPAPRHVLASALWPDAESEVALANLRPVVSELRRALGREGERLYSSGRENLAFDLNDAEVDVVRFDRAARLGDDEATVAAYFGTLLEGCPEEWVFQERNARQEAYLKALHCVAATALSSNDPHRAADLYARACSTDPTNDASRRGQMTALAAMGDVNAALEVYRDFAQTLGIQLGLTPDPGTTALYERLRSTARKSPEASPSVSDIPKERSLPKSLDDLVGRDDERSDVATLLRSSRLVTLTGSGGIGKTRLALAVANDVLPEFKDGVWFAALESLTEGRQVIQAIADVFGFQESRNRTSEEVVCESLRGNRALIVLDNCEHVLHACARLCENLLSNCPDIRILATSRESLALRGERSWPVPALAYPNPTLLPVRITTALRVVESYESVQLFAQRARVISPSFALDQNSGPAVAAICARLEGVPLAIELAAAQTGVIEVAELSQQLDDMLRLLSAGFRGSLGRQQTLRATLDWSYGMLATDEQELLNGLSVFIDGWSIDAAQAITGKECDALLGALVDKSLVTFDLSSGRYRLLETVRQYALEKLSASESRLVRCRRAQWCLTLAEDARQGLSGPDQPKWLERLQIEKANLLAAMTDLDQDPEGGLPGLRLATSLWMFWNIRGPQSEGIEQLHRALRHPGAQDESVERAGALNALGILLYHSVSQGQAKPWFEASLAIRRKLGDPGKMVGPLNNLGNLLLFEGDHEQARRRYEECLAIVESTGQKPGQALSLINLGHLLHVHLGEAAEARKIYEQVMLLMQEIGEPRGIAIAHEGLGFAALAQGDYQTAAAHQEETFAIMRDLGDQRVAWSLEHLGEIAHGRGEPTVALDYLSQSLAMFTERSDLDGLACSHLCRARSHLAKNDPEAALTEGEASLQINEKLGDPRAIGECTVVIALVHSDLHHPSEAADILARALVTLRKVDARRGLTMALDAAAGLWLCAGAPWPAVRLWGAAEAQRLRTGSAARIPDRERNRIAQEEAQARLGSSGFAAAWKDGLSLSLTDATAEALRISEIRLASRS